MKKLLALVLVLVLALSLLTACNGNGNNNGSNPTGNNSTPGNSQGANSTPGGDPANNFKYGKAEDYIANHLGDFSISYNVNMSGTNLDWKVIKTSQGVCISSGDVSSLLIKEGNSYKFYMGGPGNWMDMTELMDADDLNPDVQMEGIMGLMMNYDNFATEDFRSAGTESIAGKPCDKYTFDLAYAGTAVNYNIWIDQATGVCMKIQYDISAGGQSSGMTFECTEFLTSDVTLPKPN